ncbi:hypothetical protein DFH09DRAFT_1424496 [Mycena vulgaris]|nr:hypothetical protein DFH09DRAFT_1424496 [Mycena vulgaris]
MASALSFLTSTPPTSPLLPPSLPPILPSSIRPSPPSPALPLPPSFLLSSTNPHLGVYAGRLISLAQTRLLVLVLVPLLVGKRGRRGGCAMCSCACFCRAHRACRRCRFVLSASWAHCAECGASMWSAQRAVPLGRLYRCRRRRRLYLVRSPVGDDDLVLCRVHAAMHPAVDLDAGGSLPLMQSAPAFVYFPALLLVVLLPPVPSCLPRPALVPFFAPSLPIPSPLSSLLLPFFLFTQLRLSRLPLFCSCLWALQMHVGSCVCVGVVPEPARFGGSARRAGKWADSAACVPVCLRACVPACLRACVPACLRACVPACFAVACVSAAALRAVDGSMRCAGRRRRTLAPLFLSVFPLVGFSPLPASLPLSSFRPSRGVFV